MTPRQELIRARRLIEQRHELFICHALFRIGDDGAGRLEIMRLLQPSDSVAGWLKDVAGIPVYQLTYNNLREYRLRWIDHLLATNPVFQEQQK